MISKCLLPSWISLCTKLFFYWVHQSDILYRDIILSECRECSQPVHSLLGTSIHSFIHPFFHPSILNQMSAKGSLEHWASWWGSCCSCLLFQTWLCAHCSLARCAGSSLLVSATHPFIGTKGGNTGLVLLIPHYNVQILRAKLIRMRLCITAITHRKKLHAISVVPLTLLMSFFFVSKCMPSQNLQFNNIICAWCHQFKWVIVRDFIIVLSAAAIMFRHVFDLWRKTPSGLNADAEQLW